MKNKALKIINIILLIFNLLITFIRTIGIRGYMAAITRDFSYLDDIITSNEEKNSLIQNFMPKISGYINLMLIVLGLLIIFTLIFNFRNNKSRNIKNFLIPYILIIFYGIFDIINIYVSGSIDYMSFLISIIYILSGIIPLLISLYIQNNKIKTNHK